LSKDAVIIGPALRRLFCGVDQLAEMYLGVARNRFELIAVEHTRDISIVAVVFFFFIVVRSS
jgi:hypothetical protein